MKEKFAGYYPIDTKLVFICGEPLMVELMNVGLKTIQLLLFPNKTLFDILLKTQDFIIR